jgi:LysR family glycine cleavage system transcriptional activator
MARPAMPMNALRAFEAAARLRSLTRAAAELCVTQTAVSRHVRVLEQGIGKALFVRHASAVELTEQGRILLEALTSSFDRIAAGLDAIKGERDRRVLRISAQPNFAMRWLIPHLASFRSRHPAIDIEVVTSHRAIEFPPDGIDVAIRLGRHWTGVRAERLFGSDLFPVCSPRLLTANRPLAVPADLRHHTMLHVSTAPTDWKIWLDAARLATFPWTAGSRFDSYALALQAAVEGLGVAMGRRVFVERDLAAGRLVQPFALSVAIDEAWFLIYPDAVASRPEIRAFRSWILEEAADTARSELRARGKSRVSRHRQEREAGRGKARTGRRAARPHEGG